MDENEHKNELIKQLTLLNERIEKQVSFKHVLARGLVNGLGFVIGSVVIATILIGLFVPWFSEIDWVRETFERGSELKQE